MPVDPEVSSGDKSPSPEGEAIEGTVYERVAHELAGKSEELGTASWRRGNGAYSRLLGLAPGNLAAWEAGDARYTLVVADFDSRDNAREAFMVFMRNEDSWKIDVDGAMAADREEDGTVSVRQANGHGAGKGGGWGLAAGLAVGVLFPPTVLASAAIAGVAGVGVGKRAGKQRAHALAEELATATSAGQVRLLILVSDERLSTRVVDSDLGIPN